MPKTPAPITRAQIERAIEAGKRQKAPSVEIVTPQFTLRYSLGENNGEKSKTPVAKPRTML